jgi:hypothetical protein
MKFKNIITNISYKILIVIFAALTIVPLNNKAYAASPEKDNSSLTKETINYTITVLDKKTLLPLQSVYVTLKEGNSIVAGISTNPFGRAIFRDVAKGVYIASTHYLGYADYSETVSIDSTRRSTEFKISSKSIELGEVTISGDRTEKISTTIDINTGRQVFETETYHASPLGTMTSLITQNLAGAVRAPTGEVHIRGQHGEFSYLVDGIPIPLGVFGGLNEIVDSKVIEQVTFYTGGFPAEYGGQITGVMDIQNKVPTGSFHLDISTFAGSYLTSSDNNPGSRVGEFKALNSNGQSVSLSSHIGGLGYFITGSRQETDHRIDQPVSQLFHDHGFDYFLYGKFDYLLSADDYLTANLNYSKTLAQVPYDPVEGYISDDQESYNAYQTLSYIHTFSAVPDKESEFFAGAFVREGGLNYTPDMNDDNKVYFDGDSLNGYVVKQKRTFTTSGLRLKFDDRLSHQFKYAAGLNYYYTEGSEDFRFVNATEEKKAVISDYNGFDLGFFAQTEWHPAEWTKLNMGVRYDIHNAPAISKQYQISPRFKWQFFIDEFNSFSLSYDRLFMPTNIENLGAVALVYGNTSLPTYPEKDNLYEISFMRNWENGFSSKLSGFYKQSSPGLDDETYGSSTIRVSVNINEIKVSGIEIALTYKAPESPLSAFINSSLIHAYGTGPVSGGFLAADPSSAVFDLDHDQRLTAVIGLNYQPDNWFANATATYGSGLTNGADSYNYGKSLFDFNTGAHTAAYWVVDLSAGYTFNFKNGQSLEPSVFVSNIFDNDHLIKGAFFSGASFEQRRNVMFKLSYHI